MYEPKIKTSCLLNIIFCIILVFNLGMSNKIFSFKNILKYNMTAYNVCILYNLYYKLL